MPLRGARLPPAYNGLAANVSESRASSGCGVNYVSGPLIILALMCSRSCASPRHPTHALSRIDVFAGRLGIQKRGCVLLFFSLPSRSGRVVHVLREQIALAGMPVLSRRLGWGPWQPQHPLYD